MQILGKEGDTPSTERWLPVVGWEGLYEVSNFGRVRSIDRVVKGRHGPTRYKGRVLRPGRNKTAPYFMVQLAETGRKRKKHCYVHDLVLAAFVGPKPAGMEVCHGRNGQQDNSLDNLRYDTRSANAQDRLAFGKPHPPKTRKPPVELRCVMCGATFSTTDRRATRTNRLCKSRECFRSWMRQTALRWRARQRAA